ncbi:MAG: GNAT family N-acetyltransferase [Chloroflexota bacterium]
MTNQRNIQAAMPACQKHAQLHSTERPFVPVRTHHHSTAQTNPDWYCTEQRCVCRPAEHEDSGHLGDSQAVSYESVGHEAVGHEAVEHGAVEHGSIEIDHRNEPIRSRDQAGSKPVKWQKDELIIRPYQASDYEAVWGLHNRSLNAVNAHGGNGSWDNDIHNIEKIYQRDGGEFLVGYYQGALVAMGALLPVPSDISPDTGEICRMRVSPDYWRRGFGQQILTALEQKACEYGYHMLRLDTTTRQDAAQKLYKKNGYVEVERERWHEFILIYMEKQLVDIDDTKKIKEQLFNNIHYNSITIEPSMAEFNIDDTVVLERTLPEYTLPEYALPEYTPSEYTPSVRTRLDHASMQQQPLGFDPIHQV